MDDQLMDWLPEHVARILVAVVRDEIMDVLGDDGCSENLSLDKLPLVSACREAMHSYYCARIAEGVNARLYGIEKPTNKQVSDAYSEVVQQIATEERSIVMDALHTLMHVAKAQERYNARWN